MTRLRIAALAGLGLLVAYGVASAQTNHRPIRCAGPEIRVYKSRGTLELWCSGTLAGSFAATFGASPAGPKEREGDERTPEGSYAITSRVSNARFHRFLGVSYPNADDRRRAQEHGITHLGGGIGIHGTRARVAGLARVWIRVAHGAGIAGAWGPTDGCIALANEDVEVLYDAVPVGTPVRISP